MILQFNQSWFTFQGGLQQKIDPLLLGPPYLLKAENVVYLKSGSVQKRTGYDKIATYGIEITRLTDFDDTIISQTSSSILGYSDEVSSFSSLGTRLPLQFKHYEIIRDKYENINCDSYQYQDQYTVVAWQSNDSGTRVKYSVIDANGVTIVHNTVVSENAKTPKIVISNNYIWICYQGSADNSIYAKRIPVSAPDTIDSQLTIVENASVAATGLWDVASIPDLAAVVFAWSHSTPGIHLKYYDDLGSAGAGVIVNGFPTATSVTVTVPQTLLRVVPGTDAAQNTKHLVVYDTATTINTMIADFRLSVDVTDTTYQTITSIDRIGAVYDVDNNAWTVLTQTVDANVNLNKIYKGIIRHSDGYVPVSPAVYQRSVTLYSDPVIDNGNMYYWGLHESSIQPTYFLFKDDVTDEGFSDAYIGDGYLDGYSTSVVVGKHLQGIAGSTHSTNHICKNTFTIAMNKRNRWISEDGELTFNNQGVTLLDVTPDAINYSDIAQVGRTSLVTGSLSQTFDKHQVVEHGFSIYPETLTASQSGSSGLADGTYSYVATYEWEDSNGDIHESAPSRPLSFTVTGGPRNVAVVVPTNRITNKTGVIVNLYRTTTGGTIYYKVTSNSTSFTFNDKTVDTVTITDSTADGSLTDNPQIYTTGGVLDNIAPPYSSVATMHKGRVFLAGDPNNPSKLWFSSYYIPGEGLQFNELLTLDIEFGSGGNITALASLDDNLVVFKRNSIFLVSGIGPDRAGNQNDYNATKINTDVGCSSSASIVNTPNGLIFKSEKGIYMLSRQLEVSYIGQQVEDFNSSEILAATLNADSNHVRFVLDTGEVLYYNYLHNAWSEFTNYYATAAIVRQSDGLFYHTDTNGKLFRESSNYQDAGASIRMKIRTGWMTFGSQLQLKRVRFAGLLGKRLQDHRITWKIYKDFSDVVDESFTFDITSGDALYGSYPSWGAASYYGTDANTWGDNYEWGIDSFWGGNSNDVMEYRHHIKQQKCTSISFEISDDTLGTQTGPAATIVGFQLEWAMKKGIKRNQSRTV